MSRAGWLAAAAAVVALVAAVVSWRAEGTSGDAASGSSGSNLFRAKGCATCHDGPDSSGKLGGFPVLSDAPSWAGSRRDGYSATAYVTESIRDPSAFISPAWGGGVGPTSAMPVLALSDEEIDALTEYLLQG